LLEVNDNAKSRGVLINLSWEPLKGQPLSLNNTQYFIENSASRNKNFVYGYGDEMHKLIAESDLINRGGNTNHGGSLELARRKMGSRFDVREKSKIYITNTIMSDGGSEIYVGDILDNLDAKVLNTLLD